MYEARCLYREEMHFTLLPPTHTRRHHVASFQTKTGIPRLETLDPARTQAAEATAAAASAREWQPK